VGDCNLPKSLLGIETKLRQEMYSIKPLIATAIAITLPDYRAIA